MKFAFAVLALVSSLAQADIMDCMKFNGDFEIQQSCQGISPRSGVQIKVMVGGQTLKVTYDIPSHHPSQTETYVADGTERSGDGGTTGDKYSATCAGNTLMVRRIFSGFKWPIVNEFTFKDGGIDYVEKYEGRDGATACRFERIRP